MRRTIDAMWAVASLTAALMQGCTGHDGEPAGRRDAGPDGGIVLPDAAPGTDAGPPAECPEGHPMGDFYGKPTVEVRIDGEGPFVFVYDTGAPYSGVDDAVAERVGDGPHAVSVAGQTVEIPYLRAFDAGALGFDGIEGILGGDVMGDFAVTLDVERRAFWLDRELDEATLLACDHVAGDPVETDMAISDYLYVRGRAEDEDGWFLVDSGASLGAMPDSIFDTLQERRSRPYVEGFYTPAAIGTFWARLTTIARLEVAGRPVERIATRTVPDDLLPGGRFSDGKPLLGVLPSGYLRHFLVTVDHRREVLRLDAYADLPPSEPASFFPVGIGLAESTEPPVVVAQVLAGSSAEEEGVEVGDEILRIDGRDVSLLSPGQRPWALVRQDGGETLDVTLRREGEPDRTVTLEARDLLTAPPVGG